MVSPANRYKQRSSNGAMLLPMIRSMKEFFVQINNFVNANDSPQVAMVLRAGINNVKQACSLMEKEKVARDN